jgi:hypothetical protein
MSEQPTIRSATQVSFDAFARIWPSAQSLEPKAYASFLKIKHFK